MDSYPNESNSGNGSYSGSGNGSGTQAVLDQTKEAASRLASQAGDQIKTQLTDKKEQAMGGLDSVAQALRTTSQQLREQNQPQIGDLTETVAQRVEEFSDVIRNKDVDTLVRDVETYARQNPLLFLGGTFVLGFMAARVLKNANSGFSIGNRSRAHEGIDESPWRTEAAGSSMDALPAVSSASTDYTTSDFSTSGTTDFGATGTSNLDLAPANTPDVLTPTDTLAGDLDSTGGLATGGMASGNLDTDELTTRTTDPVNTEDATDLPVISASELPGGSSSGGASKSKKGATNET